MLFARLGIEHLPPVSRARLTLHEPASVGIEPDRPRVESVAPPKADDEPRVWDLSRERLAQIDNPFERMTLRFLRELLGDDRRRLQRELGTPLFALRSSSASPEALENQFDRRARDDEEALLRRYQGVLLNRPLRRAWREMALITDLEFALEEFKADNVPLSGAYQQAHGGSAGRHFGRFSMRVRASDGSDPVELAWIRRGLRVGVSKERARLGVVAPVTPAVSVSLRSDYDYAREAFDVWGDLAWTIDARTRLSVLMGDAVDFANGSVLYPYVRSPVTLQGGDPSIGVLMFVEHLF